MKHQMLNFREVHSFSTLKSIPQKPLIVGNENSPALFTNDKIKSQFFIILRPNSDQMDLNAIVGTGWARNKCTFMFFITLLWYQTEQTYVYDKVAKHMKTVG